MGNKWLDAKKEPAPKREATASAGRTGQVEIAEPVIKTKQVGIPPLPPNGTTAYAVAPDGNYWSIWKYHTKSSGDIEVTKEVEMLPYDAARLEVGRRVIEAQSTWLK